jgi:hypothetical protein
MQHEDESTLEYMQRLLSWVERNDGDITDDLKSIPCVVEFFEMISDSYDVSLLEEVYEVIEEGTDAKPYNDFVDKWQLPWRKLETGKFIENMYYNKSFGFIYPRVQV